MPDNLTLSPAATAMLEMIEQQSGVWFEVVHVWLDPVRRAPTGEALHTIDEPAVAEEALKALRTGEVRVGELKGAPFGVFPLRRVREIIGCIVASPSASAAEAGRVEEAGALARAVLESDLAVNAQLADAHDLTRRLHGTLRFLGQLGTYESDRDVMHAVLHAATVWFDLDCRIYERHPDGHFTPTVSLPGVEPPAMGQRLDPARAAQLVAARRFLSAGELDDLAFGSRRDEVLVLPVGIGQPSWLILLAGNLDSHADLTFSAIARVLTGELQARELARIERWQRLLTEAVGSPSATTEQSLAALLESLIKDAGVEGARVEVRHGATERRLEASAGVPPVTPDADAGAPAVPAAIDLMERPGGDASIRLALTGGSPLGHDAVGVARTWLKAVLPWVTEVAAGLGRPPARPERAAESSAFERRIHEEVERAKRFNLGLGLVLIGPGEIPAARAGAGAAPGGQDRADPHVLDTLAATLRPELRASDLLGPLSGGLAVVLVHSGAEGAESVTERLRSRLAAPETRLPPGGLQVGRASFTPDCVSADELIARARRQSRALPPVH